MRLINWPAGFIVSIGFVYGGLISPQAPLELEQRADLIVVGSASVDIQAGVKVANFDLQVTRLVKGDPAIAGRGITVSWTAPGGFLTGVIMPAGEHLVEKGTGLWFLQRSPTGWALLPAITGNSVSQGGLFPGA